MDSPIITQKHPYGGIIYTVEFYAIKDNIIPDLPWEQVYAIGNLEKTVPVVKYPEDIEYPRGLPGGHLEKGEDVECALIREIKEELNMSVLNWFPLGYEKIIAPDSKDAVMYNLRVYAELKKDGEFQGDIGGIVIGYELLKPDEVSKAIKWYERGDWLISQVREKYR